MTRYDHVSLTAIFYRYKVFVNQLGAARCNLERIKGRFSILDIPSALLGSSVAGPRPEASSGPVIN